MLLFADNFVGQPVLTYHGSRRILLVGLNMGLVLDRVRILADGAKGDKEMASLSQITRLTFPSHVQNVPLCAIVFVGMTRSMASTLSCGVIIPSTSHSVEMAAISLL